jgi:hypothetical protein
MEQLDTMQVARLLERPEALDSLPSIIADVKARKAANEAHLSNNMAGQVGALRAVDKAARRVWQLCLPSGFERCARAVPRWRKCGRRWSCWTGARTRSTTCAATSRPSTSEPPSLSEARVGFRLLCTCQQLLHSTSRGHH